MKVRVGDDEVVANIFSRAYAETGSIADAFWVTSAVIARRGSTHDISAIGLNRIIEQVAAARKLKPSAIIGRSRDKADCEARYEVWWRARQHFPPVSYPALGAAFDRHHTVVMDGVRKFEKLLAASAELRARLIWDAAERERAA